MSFPLHNAFRVTLFWLAWLLYLLTPNASAISLQEHQAESVAGNKRIEELMKSFSPRGQQADDSSPTPPPGKHSNYFVFATAWRSILLHTNQQYPSYFS